MKRSTPSDQNPNPSLALVWRGPRALSERPPGDGPGVDRPAGHPPTQRRSGAEARSVGDLAPCRLLVGR